MDFSKLKNIIVENNTFLITSHVNPDADALGSEAAIYAMLKKLNKKVYVINHSEIPYNLKFLDKDNNFEHYNSDIHDKIINEVEVIFIVDLNRLDRLVSMGEVIRNSKSFKVNIDHHQDPEDFGALAYVNTDYSATGELIYDFIKETRIVELDYEIAMPLYAAIMTDTGSFRFERTSPKIHYIAADLLEKGVSPKDVYDKIYDQSLLSKIKLLGKALASLMFHGEKKEIAYMIVTNDMIEETGAIESDTDGFVNFTLSIENIKMGLKFIELKDGFKVSLRSKGNIPVNKLAAEYGGGGHTNAAGIRIKSGSMEEFIPVLLQRSEEFLREL